MGLYNKRETRRGKLWLIVFSARPPTSFFFFWGDDGFSHRDNGLMSAAELRTFLSSCLSSLPFWKVSFYSSFLQTSEKLQVMAQTKTLLFNSESLFIRFYLHCFHFWKMPPLLQVSDLKKEIGNRLQDALCALTNVFYPVCECNI